MIKKMLKIVKKIIVSIFLLSSFNLIANPINLNIPINLYTVLSMSILGLPALLSFVIILLVIY